MLSKGSGVAGVGSSAAELLAGDPTTSLPKSQVVQMKVSTLVAEGIPVPAQPGGVQDGQVPVLRFDNYLLIGGQFYQYASGKGYPLVPVAGPVLRGEIGVQHGPIPVLLPQQEPAFSAIPAPTIVSVPAEAPAPAPAAVAPPEGNSGAGLAAPVTAAVAIPVANVATGAISSPSAPAMSSTPATGADEGSAAPIQSTAPAAVANVGSGANAPAVAIVSPSLSAIPTPPVSAIAAPKIDSVLAETPAPAAVAPPEGNSGEGLAVAAVANIASGVTSSPSAPAMPAIPAATTTDPRRDADDAAQASTPVPGSSVTTDSASSILAPATVGSGPVSPPLPTAVGSESVLAPDASGDRSLPGAGLPDEDLGTPSRPRVEIARVSDSLPAGADTTSAMTDVNPPAASTNYVNALAAEVLDMLDFGYLERRGPAQEADPDSEGDTDSDHTLVGFAIASVVGLAGGNFVFTSRNADRHYRRESETPDPV